MAEPAERAEPEAPGPVPVVPVTLDRATYDRARLVAERWGVSVEVALARLVVVGLGVTTGGTASSGTDIFPPEGLSTDGLDPDEDAYWRELHDLTSDGDAPAGATPGGASAR